MAYKKVWLSGYLGYNLENNRYGFLVSDLWENDGFHCGEGNLQVRVDGKWVKTTMEMDWSTGYGVWYLTGTPYRGDDLEHLRARYYTTIDTDYYDL